MHKSLEQIRSSAWYERIYKLTVAIKGIDGFIELATGLLLLVAPNLLHAMLRALSGEALEHTSRLMRYVAENIAHIDADIARGGLVVVILFLLTHGIVKLALVWALLKEILWAYPYALAVLFAFFVYQLYLSVTHPTVGMILFTLLDAIIIWVVWGEWRELKLKASQAR